MVFIVFLRRNPPGDFLILLKRCGIDGNRAGADGQRCRDREVHE